jgi:hypothetical protein
MENIGDWLYMIIIIIAAISSIIGSINKKKSGKQQPREIITEEDWDDYEETQPSVSYETQPVAGPQPAQQKMSPEYRPFGANKKTEKDYATFKREPTSTIALSVEENPASVSLEDMPANKEEWRKAFIYSEVFNRKY